MRAVLSGSAAVALVNDGEDWHSIRYEDLETLLPQQEEDFVRLFHEARDLDWLEETTLDDVRVELEDAVDSSEALNLVLYLLDGRLSDDTRDAAARELDELALEEVVIERVENVLLATPLPDRIDTPGAVAACRRTNCQAVLALLDSWLDLQESVTESCHAWLRIPEARFKEPEDRERIQGQLIRHGVFREMAHRCLEPGGFNEVQFQFAGDVSLKLAVPGVVGILNDWTEPFRSISRAKVTEDQRAEPREKDFEESTASAERKKKLPLSEILRRVAHFKEQIVAAMHRQPGERVHELIEELVEFQSQHGKSEYCCMSLCDLAAIAQQQHQFSIQFMLTSRAVRLKPDDARSWTQHGVSLSNIGDYVKSLEAYDRAAEYGEDVVVQTGRASVLVLMRRWDDALDALHEAERDGGDWVTRHIRAVIFLRTNRREDARSILRDGVNNCPESESRDYFRATLAQLLIPEGKLQSARELVEQMSDCRLGTPRSALLTHILEQEGKLEEARQACERLPEPTNDEDAEVFAELQLRAAGSEPAKSNDWLQDQILRMVLTA